jgi:hypothetical protein
MMIRPTEMPLILKYSLFSREEEGYRIFFLKGQGRGGTKKKIGLTPYVSEYLSII